ncbi:hypothetical protein HMPREF3157_05370 [Dermabacter sp. HMSC06F07]|uniref:DUF4235 domain-containing protein n=2 Tax=Dermabacter TaxID=36739 RepID=A0ABR4SLM4_9MICO|nr:MULTISPECIES: DUF4235 domain-containing protein [Dermabacter]KDS94098.1 hypothetical protein DHOM_02420 [Dermabacter hominis 1368]ATH96081.1 DUF4235 domain-containing protein [Dermabacter jinjuensis]EPH18300.1 hypothetical protein HMPREF1484_00159 [Dermabacter sp. HFH0086]MCT1709538.1 DUF4235 domain-containing protein [Dermabacter hominis]MCT1807489.1 DUF4235 domain-containing protein [Dermabacter hominis]
MPSKPSNPLVGAIVTVAGIGTSILAKKALEAGWHRAFDEEVPDSKFEKQAKKDLKARQKQAKKDGASKAEIKAMTSEYDDVDAWKVALFTILSGVVISGLQQVAKKGAQSGAERLVARRPRANRG